ncbi:MAG: hypothetical protein WKF37_23550 [Bryobacteraceae bacterium]
MQRFLVFLLTVCGALAQEVTGDWVFKVHESGQQRVGRLSFALQGTTLSGKFDNRPVEGTFNKGLLDFRFDNAKDGLDGRGVLKGRHHRRTSIHV